MLHALLKTRLPGIPRDPEEKSTYLEALRESIGTMPGIFAWAMVTGMAMVKSGLSTVEALLMSVLVFAGSAQLAPVLGTLMLGILSGSKRYAHLAGIRGDQMAAQALGPG